MHEKMNDPIESVFIKCYPEGSTVPQMNRRTAQITWAVEIPCRKIE